MYLSSLKIQLGFSGSLLRRLYFFSMLLKEIHVASSTDPSRVYTIRVERDPDRVFCDCVGCMTHGYCKHIKFYYHAIQRILHEKPRL
jgi:hypothetical protein